MSNSVVVALRAIIALALAGSLGVQLMIVPLLWLDMAGAPLEVRVSLAVIAVLGVLTMQVVGVCIWRLVTLVRRGTVFSHAAFRYVDVIIRAIAAAAALTFGLALVGVYANRTAPDDVIAPGVVGLICGAALVGAGVALVVLVLRTLLAQAVALDSRAQRLQSELDDVI